MSSPFLEFTNATIAVTYPTGELGRDEVGNAIALLKTQNVSAKLKMLPLQSARKRDQSPGVDASAILMEGHCVEPMLLPRAVEPENWFRATWDDREGWFYLLSPINPPHGRTGIGRVMEEVEGTKIIGWFQVNRNG